MDLVTILAFFLILSLIVLIHELGHFLTAKKFGIKVEEFGFGFPPRMFGIKKGETVYSVNWLPVGGFVKLYGEDDAGGGSVKRNTKHEITKGNLKRAFFVRPAWQRAIIVVAGVVMNFLLAVVLISFLFAAQGVAIPGNTIRVVDTLKNSPSFVAGIKKDDVIVAIGDKKISKTEDFIAETKKHLGEALTLTIKRGDSTFTVTLIPRTNYPKGEGPMGIGITNIEIKKYAWYEAPFFGTIEAFKFSYMIASGIGMMIFDLVLHGTKPAGVAGPVGVAQLTGQAVSGGLYVTLWFISLLSLNLAVLNILPIPALDGGRLFFILIELVTRKKINPKYETYAHAAGLVALLALIVLITFFDVARLIAGKSILQP